MARGPPGLFVVFVDEGQPAGGVGERTVLGRGQGACDVAEADLAWIAAMKERHRCDGWVRKSWP